MEVLPSPICAHVSGWEPSCPCALPSPHPLAVAPGARCAVCAHPLAPMTGRVCAAAAAAEDARPSSVLWFDQERRFNPMRLTEVAQARRPEVRCRWLCCRPWGGAPAGGREVTWRGRPALSSRRKHSTRRRSRRHRRSHATKPRSLKRTRSARVACLSHRASIGAAATSRHVLGLDVAACAAPP